MKSLDFFLDGYKYAPLSLLERLNSDVGFAERLRSPIAERIQDLPWPKELKSPDAIIVGLLGMQIAQIMSPYARRSAADEFYEFANRLGFNRSMVRMICADLEEVSPKVADLEIEG
jgi:hypothetical protein